MSIIKNFLLAQADKYFDSTPSIADQEKYWGKYNNALHSINK